MPMGPPGTMPMGPPMGSMGMGPMAGMGMTQGPMPLPSMPLGIPGLPPPTAAPMGNMGMPMGSMGMPPPTAGPMGSMGMVPPGSFRPGQMPPTPPLSLVPPPEVMKRQSVNFAAASMSIGLDKAQKERIPTPAAPMAGEPVIGGPFSRMGPWG